MSVRYRDKDGNETLVAGMGRSGELVPSVSYYQTGSGQAGSVTAGGYKDIKVTLNTAMPDTDYVIVPLIATGGDKFTVSNVYSKTAAGFTMRIHNYSDAASDTGYTWQAFKLMTDESRALDEAAIAANTTAIEELNAYAGAGQIVWQKDTVTDINECIPKESGYLCWWRVSNSVANTPSATYGLVIAIRSGTTVRQYWSRTGAVLDYSRSIECTNAGVYASTNKGWTKMLTESDITIYTPADTTMTTIDDFLAHLYSKGQGNYVGTVYIGSWYDYHVRIVIGSAGYWYGMGEITTTGGVRYIVSKTYSTSSTWKVDTVTQALKRVNDTIQAASLATANAYGQVGTYTIPAGKSFALNISIWNNNSYWKGIKVNGYAGTIRYYAASENADENSQSVQINGYAPSAVTLTILAKPDRANSGQNNITVSGLLY